MTFMTARILTSLAGTIAVLCLNNDSFAQGTAFTYQGRLNTDGAPANDTNDFTFTLFLTDTSGTPVAGPVTIEDIRATNGLFVATVDFGTGVLTGAVHWLEIGVRPGDSAGGYTMLTPRQRLSPTPYAIHSLNANTAGAATIANSVANGAVTTAALQNNAVTSAKIANGTIQATDLDTTLLTQTFWRQDGNAGTTPGTHFIGTTDNQPLEFKVNGQRGLRLEPNVETPNVVGGVSANNVMPGIKGATIAGGGLPFFPNQITADFATIGGGTFHVAGGSWATIAGGRDNRAYSESSGILSGRANLVESNSLSSVIVGGDANAIREGNMRVFIGAGVFNTIQADSDYSVIVGGRYNTNEASAQFSVIGGGAGNRVESSATFAVVAGGTNNSAGAGFRAVTVVGGEANRAAANHATVVGGLNNFNTGPGATIGGGNSNRTVGNDTVVAGGFWNEIRVNSYSSAIGGGKQNIIQPDSHFATIGGGYYNRAAAPESTIPGGALNNALAFSSTIGGGGGNSVSGNWATIAGGRDNSIANPNDHATVTGGYRNQIQPDAENATISGGIENVIGVDSGSASISGGAFNGIGQSANSAVVGGGIQNSIGANSYQATIAGGYANRIGDDSYQATVSGGVGNTIRELSFHSTISGGQSNVVTTSHGTIGGGLANSINADSGTIAGGIRNLIQPLAQNSTIAGGIDHLITGAVSSTIGGGWTNRIYDGAYESTIGGGSENVIQTNAYRSTIGGGYFNRVETNAHNASIGGGSLNIIQPNANNATIPGGRNNMAFGECSFAAGRRATANHDGTFVWADFTDANFTSTGDNQFLIRANGGVGVNKNDPSTALDVNGTVTAASFSGPGGGLTGLNASALISGTVPDARQSSNIARRNQANTFTGSQIITNTSSGLAGAALRITPASASAIGLYVFQTSSDATVVFENRGSGSQIVAFNAPGNEVFIVDNDGDVFAKSYTSTSDRNRKENFAPVNPSEVLEKIAALPISRWNFKGDHVTHVGPMAQDFHAAFGIGPDDKHIATVDADGVALAAIQGLNQKLEVELKNQDARINSLEARLERLEKFISKSATVR